MSDPMPLSLPSRLLRRFSSLVLFTVFGSVLGLADANASPSSALGGGYMSAGLTGEYYTNTNFSGTPQFTRRDPRLAFAADSVTSWGGSRGTPYANFPVDNFSVRWTGQLRARFGETYTLRAVADDAVVVRIRPAGSGNYTTVIDQSAFVEAGTTGTYAFTAGAAYDIQVEYKESSGAAGITLSWSSPSTPSEVIDVATELSINVNTYEEDLMADAMKNGRLAWDPVSGGPSPVPVDALGWPLSDAGFIVSETLAPYGLSPLETGDMTLSFKGRATIGRFGNNEIVAGSVAYDPATNTTNALVRGVNLGINVFQLSFTDTDRDGNYGSDGLPDGDGITDVKLMRINTATGVSYPETQIFNNNIRQAFDRFTALRFQRVNDQAINWADRTQPTHAFPLGRIRPFVYNSRYDGGQYNLQGTSFSAHELEIMLCNEIGLDYFVTVPHLGTTGAGSYMENLARLIRYGSDANGNPYTGPTANPYHPPLNSNLRVYLELSNELWNFASIGVYAAFYDLREVVEDIADNNTPDFAILNYDNLPTTLEPGNSAYHVNNYTWTRRYWALKLVRMSDTFRSVFGDAAMPGNGNRDPRIRPFFTWQYGDTNATASTGLLFMDDYFNNGAGNFVSTPRPANHYFWSGGGAGYYSTQNREGLVSPNSIPNHSFEAVSVGSPATNPGGHSWTFSANSGVVSNRVRTTAVTGQSVAGGINNINGHVGHRFTVGANPITVYELGRYVMSGNDRSHVLRIARVSDGKEITFTTDIPTAGATPGTYVYGRCVPVTLAANTSYYLLSSETSGGDTFGGPTSSVSTNGAYSVVRPVTATLNGTQFTVTEGSGSGTYGPLAIRYASVQTVAGGTALNHPDAATGSGVQSAWLQSRNGTQGSASVTFMTPSTQQNDGYALSFRWAARVKTDAHIPDEPQMRITATVNGVTTEITSSESGTQPRAWSPGIEWKLLRFWVGDYYSSIVFNAPAATPVTITFSTTSPDGDHVAFLDDVRLTGIDAFYDGSFLGAGAAMGQNSAAYTVNQYNDGKWAASYGLVQMTYEHGFSAGGDSGNTPLQNTAKFASSAARQSVIEALEVFQESGGRVPTFGTYSTWPSHGEVIDGERVFGTGDAGAFPLTQGLDYVMGRLPRDPLSGPLVPATIPGGAQTLSRGGSSSGELGVNQWRTYSFVVLTPDTYRLTLNTTGGGTAEWRLNAFDNLSTASAGTPRVVTRWLNYGVHSMRVRSTSGGVTVTSMVIEQPDTPAAPVINSVVDGDRSLNVNWSSVPGATSYRIFWGLTSGSYPSSASVGTATGHTIPNLQHDTQYYIVVRAYDADGSSLASAERSAVALAAGQTGTLLSWEFDGRSGFEPSVPPSTGSSRLNISIITRGPGFKAGDIEASRTNRFGAEATDNNYETSLSGAVGANDYYEFTVSPVSGQRLSLAQLAFIAMFQNEAGGQGLGYAYRVGTGSFSNATPITYVDREELYTLNLGTISALQNVTQAVTFRIYLYGLGAYQVNALGAPSGTDIAVRGSLTATTGSPVITTQPSDVSVTAGNSATFSVQASGSPTPTIQWQFSDNGGASWSPISGATGFSYTIASPTSANAGLYRAMLTNTNGTITTNPVTLTVNPSGGGGITGSFDRDYWTGISGNTIASLTGASGYPNSPTGGDEIVGRLEAIGWVGSSAVNATLDYADTYGQRLYGYLVPATSGTYTFWVTGDDDVEFWLSTNSSPTNRVRTAWLNGWAPQHNYTIVGTANGSLQKSNPVTLQAGVPYFFEVLHKEGGGGDHVSVAWSTDANLTPTASNIIPASRLSSYAAGVPGGGGNSAPSVTLAASATSGPAPLTVNFTATGTDPNGDTLTYLWNADDGLGQVSGGTTRSITFPSAGTYTVQVQVSDGSLTATASQSITVGGGTGGGTDLAAWDFAGTNGAATSPADQVVASLSASAAGLGAGLTAIDFLGNGLTAREQTAATLAAALTGNDYITFTLTPTGGQGLTVTSLKLRPISQNRERTFAVFSSVAGFASGSQIGSFNATANSDAAEITVPITGVTNRTTAVEFRIYIYGGTDSWESAGLGNAAGNDLVVVGTLGGSNQAPVAVLTASTTGGQAPLAVTLDATGSYDPELAALTYEWNFDDGNGFVAGSSTENVTFPIASDYTVQVRVSDGVQTATQSLVISVTASGGSGNLAVWDFAGTAGAASSTPDFVAANLTASSASLGAGLTPLNYISGDGLSGREQTATTLAGALAGNDYLAFTLTPNSGRNITVTSLKLRPISQNRSRTFVVFSNVGGFGEGQQLGSFSATFNSDATEFTVPISGVSNRSTAVEFRIYIYGGTDSWEGVGLGQSAGDDLIVIGTAQ